MHALVLVLAGAGSGSSSFGGGGGSSGGGSSYGGGGSSSGTSLPTGVWIAIIVGGLLFVAYGIFTAWRARERRKARVAQTELAAAEAAEDDPYFAAPAVCAAARELFTAMQAAWDARDRTALRALAGDDLLVEWGRRLDDLEAKGWHNRVHDLRDVEAEYVGLVNREDDAEDRVVVRISATMADYVVEADGTEVYKDGAKTRDVAVAEWWTLARRGDRWLLLSIEGDEEGVHNLDAPLVPSPWADARVADEALVEQAVADRALPGYAPADLADLDFDGDARTQAMDLALADGRFAPDVLEAAARAAIDAWLEAVDGADDALRALASPEAAAALLGASDGSKTRVVVRGAVSTGARITALHAPTGAPATMDLAVALRGRRYVEDRDTAAVLDGSPTADTSWDEAWTFALDGPDRAPWRLVAVSSPAPG